MASHGYDLEREYALTRKMLEHRVDGMALIGLTHSTDTMDLLREQEMPSLLLWNHDPASHVTCVGSDNARAGQLVADHVLSLGHRRIATLFPPEEGNDRAGQRRAAVYEAMTRAGVTQPEGWRIETPYSITAAKEAVRHLVQNGSRPTAIICGNDVLAWGALHALAAEGLNVPDDMSVTGIGDFRGSRDFEPALTTVRIPAREIGRRAAETIAGAITAPQATQNSLLIPTELVLRATTATPRTT